ncbi:hypothetical protein SDC9_88711 [bioreactor metagenome]|uniref:Uncharacterized protein n=1 Tax=bioreactor metagenome TaxID=1076179 RepID=A0A644ZM87_9ZZZZ
MFILCRRGQKQRLQSRAEMLVNAGKLPLHVPVRAVAHTPDNDVRAVADCVIRQKAGPQLRMDVGVFRNRRLHQPQLLLRREHLVLFCRVGTDANPNRVEAGRRPSDNIQMPQSDGVEAAGANCCSHVADSSLSPSPALRKSVTAILP